MDFQKNTNEYENEHLPLDEQTKETVRVEWEDGS